MIDGKKIKKIRTGLNLSQSAVAEKADISQTQLSRIESGLGDTTTGVASAVARALGVGLSEILVSENPTSPGRRSSRLRGERRDGWRSF